MKKKTLILIIALAVLLAAAVAAYFLLSPSAAEGTKAITVNVYHLDGTVKTFELKTDAEFLRGALEPEGIIAGTEDSYGLWVQTVDGETADDALQQWWGYDVNGEMAMYGVDTQVVNDGDVIDFTLNEGY